MIGSRFERVISEGFSKRPDSAGNAMAVRDDIFERALDPVAVVVGDDQRGQKLNRMAGVSRDLDEDLMIPKEGERDQLTKEALVHRFQQAPCSLEF